MTDDARDAARYRFLRLHWDDWCGMTWSEPIGPKLDRALDDMMAAVAPRRAATFPEIPADAKFFCHRLGANCPTPSGCLAKGCGHEGQREGGRAMSKCPMCGTPAQEHGGEG